MNLLHIDSSILGDHSVSKKLSAELVKHLKSHADYSVTYRDLGGNPLSHLSGAYLAGQPADVKHDQALQEELDLGGAVLAEFLASDVIVIGAPMYNFTIPSQLKAWIDRVLKAGSTFHYVDGKPEGLAAGKRVIVAVSRGGFYGDDTPYASYQHQEGLLRTVFGFMGIGDVRFIRAEGLARGPEQRERSIAAALADIHALPVAA